jgi:Mg-chelatase subunit ChlD
MTKTKDGEATTKRRAKSKKDKKVTYIAVVVDKSYSMQTVREAALSGINEQISAIKANADKGGETFVTMIEFNNVIEILFDKKKAADLLPLAPSEYVPSGTTAWYDAIYTAINRLRAGQKPTDDTAYLVVVISDGQENASRECTAGMLADEIQKLQATGKWTFTYMLSNVDPSQVQNTLGIPKGNIAQYNSDMKGTALAFSSMARSTSDYLGLRAVGVTGSDSFYGK